MGSENELVNSEHYFKNAIDKHFGFLGHCSLQMSLEELLRDEQVLFIHRD